MSNCPFDPHFSAISTLFTQREKEKKKKSNFADRAKIREIKFREDFLRKNFFPKGISTKIVSFVVIETFYLICLKKVS